MGKCTTSVASRMNTGRDSTDEFERHHPATGLARQLLVNYEKGRLKDSKSNKLNDTAANNVFDGEAKEMLKDKSPSATRAD